MSPYGVFSSFDYYLLSGVTSLSYRCTVPCCASLLSLSLALCWLAAAILSRLQAPIVHAPAVAHHHLSCCRPRLQPDEPTTTLQAARHRHRLVVAHLLQRSASLDYYHYSPPCAVLRRAASLSQARYRRPPTPARQIVLPHYDQRLACRNPRATHFHMLATPHTCLFPAATLYCLPPRLDTSTTTLRLGPFFHYTQHTRRALPSRQQKLTPIFLLRQHLCQQRPKSYYGLGRNRRGKLFLRPEPDPLPFPTNLLRPSADTIAQSLYQPRPAETTPDSVPACRVDVTEDTDCLCGS